MRTHRMLRAGSPPDVARSPLPARDDERQGAFDLEQPLETVDQRVERLSYENAKLRMQLAQTDAPARSSPTFRAYNPVHGWTDKIDAIAALASGFAAQLAQVQAIRSTDEADEADAASVNAAIAMVAQEADTLISALIEDAEARGLGGSGKWMDIPLVECQEFEGPSKSNEIYQ